MKIAYIISHINKSLQWNWFSEELISREIQHIYIVINDYYPMVVDDLEKLGVPVYYLPHKNLFSHVINLIKVIIILNRHKINIVHTELPYGNLLGQLAAIILRVKKRVVTCENATWGKDYNSIKQRIIDWFAYKSAKKIVALTDLSKQYLCKTYNINNDKVVSIGHAIKLSEYENVSLERVENLKKRLAILDDEFIIGNMARLEHWKGHKYIIEAMIPVIRKHPDVKLHIFGSKGPEYDSIIHEIKEKQLTTHVFYHGFVEDPVALYPIFDVHIHVPINKMAETFGITVIEGMISGCAQILTNSGISITSAKHEQNAIVIDYCNSDQIVEAILKFKNDLAFKQKLSHQAKMDAANDYNYQTKIDKHLQIYEHL